MASAPSYPSYPSLLSFILFFGSSLTFLIHCLFRSYGNCGADIYFCDYLRYQLEYKAPAAPQLAQKIVQLLTDSKIPSKLDKHRNWDHGVFIPLKVMYPSADIPVVEVLCAHSNLIVQL